MSVVDLLTVQDLEAAVADPQSLLDKMINSSLTLAKKVALTKVRSTVEPSLQSAGLTWEQTLTAVDMITLVCSCLQ